MNLSRLAFLFQVISTILLVLIFANLLLDDYRRAECELWSLRGIDDARCHVCP